MTDTHVVNFSLAQDTLPSLDAPAPLARKESEAPLALHSLLWRASEDSNTTGVAHGSQSRLQVETQDAPYANGAVGLMNMTEVCVRVLAYMSYVYVNQIIMLGKISHAC